MDNRNELFEKYKKWNITASILVIVMIVMCLSSNKDTSAIESVTHAVSESPEVVAAETEKTVMDYRQEFFTLLENGDHAGAVLIYNEKLSEPEQEECLTYLYEFSKKVKKDWEASEIDF